MDNLMLHKKGWRKRRTKINYIVTYKGKLQCDIYKGNEHLNKKFKKRSFVLNKIVEQLMKETGHTSLSDAIMIMESNYEITDGTYCNTAEVHFETDGQDIFVITSINKNLRFNREKNDNTSDIFNIWKECINDDNISVKYKLYKAYISIHEPEDITIKEYSLNTKKERDIKKQKKDPVLEPVAIEMYDHSFIEKGELNKDVILTLKEIAKTHNTDRLPSLAILNKTESDDYDRKLYLIVDNLYIQIHQIRVTCNHYPGQLYPFYRLRIHSSKDNKVWRKRTWKIIIDILNKNRLTS